jgi:outer membrane protein TolC
MLNAQTEKVTLEECVRLSLESSDEVKIGQSKIEESKAKISEVTSQNLPQLKFSAGYSRLSSVDPFLVTVPNSPVPFKIADALFNNYSLRLSATQLVFSGFRLSALENIAGFGNEISGVDYEETRNNVSFEALSAYWNLYKAMLSAQIAEQSILQTERRINDTKNFYRGLVNKY